MHTRVPNTEPHTHTQGECFVEDRGLGNHRRIGSMVRGPPNWRSIKFNGDEDGYHFHIKEK